MRTLFDILFLAMKLQADLRLFDCHCKSNTLRTHRNVYWQFRKRLKQSNWQVNAILKSFIHRPENKPPRKLSLFEVTNLVIGAIIGADIYVASSFGAGFLGPFSLVVWVVAGLIAIVIALCFAQCAMMLP